MNVMEIKTSARQAQVESMRRGKNRNKEELERPAGAESIQEECAGDVGPAPRPNVARCTRGKSNRLEEPHCPIRAFQY